MGSCSYVVQCYSEYNSTNTVKAPDETPRVRLCAPPTTVRSSEMSRHRRTPHPLGVALVYLASLPLTASYCTWAGSNPYWVGAPIVEQVTLTSVRVSWHGLLKREDCADSMIIKHYKGTNTADYGMSEPQSVSTNSFIVTNLQPSQAYTYQVIAREEKGLLGVDYNRSPKTVFTTKKTNQLISVSDPLPTTQSSGQENLEVTETPRDVTGVAPIYGLEPKTTIVGLQLEVFMGIIYNCVRRKDGEKDLELDSSIGYEDEEDEEDDEDDEDEYEDEGPEARKYNMMINDSHKSIEQYPVQH